MADNMEYDRKVSVRSLVEFILRSGDLDNRITGPMDTEAMQEGSRIHRMLQKQMGKGYQAEVPLRYTIPVIKDDISYSFTIEGRADGIFRNPEQEEKWFIDEIKGMYMDLAYLDEPIPVHLAQAKCYAFIYAKQNNLSEIGIRMTYCNIQTKAVRYFEANETVESLEIWFFDLLERYAKWLTWQNKWIAERNLSIKNIDFPFSYRHGQRELVIGVYQTILRQKNVFIEAPTGVGKTISTIFPAVKSMGEGKTEKLFYLTAKTITRAAAEETFQLLRDNGASIKTVTITAKEKICILDKPDCNPVSCPRAKGHFERVNDAVFALLTAEHQITRKDILSYAEKFNVCPFELCLDITVWCDAVICDYNYIFDPNVALKRFFQSDKKQNFVFLIDEAHNLVDRAREMYSAVIYKEEFLNCKKIAALYSRKLAAVLDTCNKDMLELKRECEECEILQGIGAIPIHLMRLTGEMEEFLPEHKSFEKREELLSLYFNIRHFLGIFERLDENYLIYTDYEEEKGFRLQLKCMNPSVNVAGCLDKGRSAVLFSATLLPVSYYMGQLGGKEEDYAVYAPSPFNSKKRLILFTNDVSTKYDRRNQSEYQKITEYLISFVRSKIGNYLIFFPSYQYMNEIQGVFQKFYPEIQFADDIDLDQKSREIIFMQNNHMSEFEKEQFLEKFVPDKERTKIGFCVMGGIFGEGIDLKHDRLIGAAIVGTGLPMVCTERELYRSFYDEKEGEGFAFAYLYPGVNKVLQAAGRVIRTDEDKGVILLLDSRFLQRQYQNLLPREWIERKIVNQNTIKTQIEQFWREET